MQPWDADADRALSARAMIERVRPLMAAMGITRLADLTGLDRIGVPVFAAVRPNSRSVATSQGKGLAPDAARVGALMEAVESWHAERPPGLVRYASARDLAGLPLADIARLPRMAGQSFDPDRPILWSEGRDLATGEPRWLPFELVHTDYRLPQPPSAGCFPVTSNGLGAAITEAEAVRHALLEVIERDALSVWQQRPLPVRLAGRVALDATPELAELAGALRHAGLDVALHDVTGDLAVPTFLAVLADRCEPDGHAGLGSASHPSPALAALKALLEAVQVRTGYIAGARDDLAPAEFAAGGPQAKTRRIEALLGDQPVQPLRPAGPEAALPAEAQVAWLLERLSAAGVGEAILVDLGRPEIGLAVVRVVVAGLEAAADDPGYRPGARALAARAGR